MSTALHVITEESVGLTLPVLIAGAGERASWRFVEFFTVNIRNKNTRAAYHRAAGLTIEDYYVQKRHAWLRLHEKNGKVNDMPCHPKLVVYLDDYLDAAGVTGDRKDSLLFRSAAGKTKELTSSPMSHVAGIATPSAPTPSAPRGLPTISPTTAASRSPSGWPGTRMRRRRVSTTARRRRRLERSGEDWDLTRLTERGD